MIVRTFLTWGLLFDVIHFKGLYGSWDSPAGHVTLRVLIMGGGGARRRGDGSRSDAPSLMLIWGLLRGRALVRASGKWVDLLPVAKSLREH